MSKILTILKSVRFYFAIVGAIVLYLGQEGVISIALMDAIIAFLGTGITVRTLDRLFKK